MKRFRCAREFIEQYLTNNLNYLTFEMFATGKWENEYPDKERYQIYKEYLNKLSQLGKRGKNKIINLKTSLPFKEKDFASWKKVKELFNIKHDSCKL